MVIIKRLAQMLCMWEAWVPSRASHDLHTPLGVTLKVSSKSNIESNQVWLQNKNKYKQARVIMGQGEIFSFFLIFF